MQDEVDLLLRGGVGGVDGEGTLELGERGLDVTGLLEDAAAVDVGCGGEEAEALGAGLVAYVRGVLDVGLAIAFVGCIPVFVELGGLGTLVPGASGLGACRRDGTGRGEGQESEERCAEERFGEKDSATHAWFVCFLLSCTRWSVKLPGSVVPRPVICGVRSGLRLG